ncbi:MAG: hypothetical protein DBX42_00095 [Azospirillum sp.]|mgnify:FL=1|jgi:hypothetical protein|uniref:hypothetical protein n=1 Tax=Clostridium sp. OM04-7 TaxID=2293042 RepID=UPI000D79C9F5|nr:hypothetical protein [Clostridium sp. OM04-7]PWM98021.1 MAG: hypothetical protein DBX42_00095 [Azospirillum sp.]RHV33069.1 hypothetical protein DXB56_07495 [Clostridium sp. OM04-7]
MDRKETTKFLGELLERQYLSGLGKHWAKEVNIDPGSARTHRRIDYMLFQPAGQCNISDIEKGIFICYEIKSCKADVYSGNGLNFIGEKNYIVTTMQCYKDIKEDYLSGALDAHIRSIAPGSSTEYGIIVAIPKTRMLEDEFQNPTPLDGNLDKWKLAIAIKCFDGRRKRSMVELLFCMLRSGR